MSFERDVEQSSLVCKLSPGSSSFSKLQNVEKGRKLKSAHEIAGFRSANSELLVCFCVLISILNGCHSQGMAAGMNSHCLQHAPQSMRLS